MSITLKQLDAFLAVTKTLSFSKAAGSVHLSQPALSANIRRLEEAIGARLFDRDTRTVALTPVGAEFAGIARGLLENVEHGLAHIRRYATGERGTLSLAMAPSLAASFLPDVIGAFAAAHPEVELRLFDVLSDEAIEMVRARAVDLALTPRRNDADDLLQRDVMLDDLVVLCSARHPLSGRRAVTWEDLIAHPHIAKKGGSGVRHIVDEEYLKRGEAFRPAFEVENVGTMIGLIVAGLGYGVFPRSTTGSFNMKGLVLLPFVQRIRPRRRISATTLKVRSPNAAVEAFVRLCRQKAKGEAGKNE
jgi:DNA-binding transcriptional LysR family regulator